uniref:protein mono-ADP-ribosyltransferase PARP14-like isoform X2 n=1 Tax=Styela clava TaxID=7725 RepID=UPI001939B6D0|nr:protein mono-ADP-ribosyltransferase PARP14-like isoform X2 [Styela clava]
MENRTVHVTGFPSSVNKVKLKLFVENNIGPNIIEDVEKRADVAVFIFKHPRGLQKFLNAGLNEYTFGNENYKLTVIQQLTEQHQGYDTGPRHQQRNQRYGPRNEGFRNERPNQPYRQNPGFEGGNARYGARDDGYVYARTNQPYLQNPGFQIGDPRYGARDNNYGNERTNQPYRQNPGFGGRDNNYGNERTDQPYRQNPGFGGRDNNYGNDRTDQPYRQNPGFGGRDNKYGNERTDQPHRQNPRFDRGDADQWRRILYVTQIPQHLCNHLAFSLHFQRFGPLEHCLFKPNRKNPGFHGYVTFRNHNDACRARHEGVNAGPMSNLSIQWADSEGPKPTPNFNEPGPGPRRSSATSDDSGYSTPGNRGRRKRRPNANSAGISRMGKAPSMPDLRPPTPSRPLNEGPQHAVLDPIQEELFTETHYWNTLKKMPETEGSICVLAQNIDPSKHIDTVKMHFENKKRSNGGPVKSVIRMIDGLLIVFESKEDCESCSGKQDQKFDGKDISVFPKSIPSYFEQTFMIEGVGEATTQDTLTMYLETSSTNEASPVSLKKQDIQGVYLVEYGDDFDISERDSFLEKIRKKPLEDRTLKASRLLRTDCLKASGIPDSVTNDTIRLTFESKKRTDGGPVTRIDRIENQITLVYFASYIDTARVCKRFKKPSSESIIIGQHPVEVELYFHSLSNLHKSVEKSENGKSSRKGGKKDPPKPTPRSQKNETLSTYIYKPECHDKIFFFIRLTKAQVNKIKDVFKDLANVELCHTAKEGKFVKFVPEKDPGMDTQDGFDTECKTRFDDFITKFLTLTQTFDKDKLSKAISLNVCPYLNKPETKNDINIRWQPNQPIVTVTGLKESVDKIMKEIETSINSTVAEMSVNEEQYRILTNCGILSELQAKHKKVQLKLDDAKHSVTLQGPEVDVSRIQIDALTILNTVEKRKLSDVDESIVRYLLESASQSNIVISKIQDKLKIDNIKASLGIDDDELCLRSRSDDEFKKTIRIIKEMVATETIKTDQSGSSLVKSPAWRGFQQNLKKSGIYGLYIKPNQSLILVSELSELRILKNKVNSFLDENSIKCIYITMKYGQAKFIVERSEEYSMEKCKQKSIKCSLTPENGGGLCIEGKRKPLEDAHSALTLLQNQVIEQTTNLNIAGIKEYYQTKGKKFLSTTEKMNDCIILMSPLCEDWVKFNPEARQQAPVPRSRSRRPASSNTRAQQLASVTLANSSVTLTVWKVDITKHTCDVIVNTSNPELKLLAGGVSGVIKNLDVKNGNQIQTEMNRIIGSNRGNLLPGDAVLTGAGNLPSCKKIVHAVGPRWDSQSDRSDPSLLLKACVSKSLEEVENHQLKSIAMPAISCGVFGGNARTCIPLILEAIAEYFKDTASSVITKIDLVENSKQDILDELVRNIKKHGTNSSPSNSTAQSNQNTQPQVASLNISCNVSLVQGDITTRNDDVIVSISPPKHIADMSGSAVSKALLKKAGQRILQECAQINSPSMGQVFETSGGGLGCQKLYHGIVGHYSANTSEAIVKSVVKNSLNMADRAGYRSIVFPAIATGGFKHPPQLVAKWMKSQISKFNATNIQNITILLYPGNQAVINAFTTGFNQQSAFTAFPSYSNPPTSSSTSFHQKINSTSAKFGSVVVSVYQGDITIQNCDVIVNSVHSGFDLTKGMISSKILQMGGQQIQTEASTGKGSYVITSSGNLPCGNIIHLVVPTDAKDLEKKLVEVFDAVEKSQYSSVCVPALGTGNLNMDSITVSSVMRASIEKFVRSNPRYLQQINIVIYDRIMLQDFIDAIVNDSTKKKGFFTGIYETPSEAKGWIPPQRQQHKDESLNLYFYSTSETKIQQAIKSVTEETNKVVQKQTIDDDAIGRLSSWERFEIYEVAKRNKVTISDESNRYIKRLSIEGMTAKVFKSCDEIKTVLKDFVSAETSSQYVTWQRQTSSNRWDNFQPRSAHVLEVAYKAHNGNKTDPTLNRINVPYYKNNALHRTIVDLSTLENDLHGRNPPKVRRKINEKSADDVLPDYWSDMKGQQLIKVKLSSTSAEYQTVLTKFIASGQFHQTIIHIERIQHISLYKQYAAKKAEVTGNLQGSGVQVERELFHGTTDEDKIIQNGFDRSYAGKNATAYGKGVYFALNATYSQRYAHPNSRGEKRMFLANVVTGYYCKGDSSMVAPPPRTNSNIDLHDSVVDSISAPTIWVIFKDASAYPTYLITFQ